MTDVVNGVYSFTHPLTHPIGFFTFFIITTKGLKDRERFQQSLKIDFHIIMQAVATKSIFISGPLNPTNAGAAIPIDSVAQPMAAIKVYVAEYNIYNTV